MTQHTPIPEGWQGPIFNSEHHIPVRKIPKSAVAITGRFWSEKMARHVLHESMLEKRLFEILEDIPNVWQYLEQPIRIPICGDDGEIRLYTPDLLVVLDPPPSQPWRFAPLLIEVKPAARLLHWVRENEAKILAASVFARQNGMIFRILTNEEIVERKEALILWLKAQLPVLITDQLHLPILRVVADSTELKFFELMRRFEIRGFSRHAVADTVSVLLREGFLNLDARGGETLGGVLRLRVPVNYLAPSTHNSFAG